MIKPSTVSLFSFHIHQFSHFIFDAADDIRKRSQIKLCYILINDYSNKKYFDMAASLECLL